MAAAATAAAEFGGKVGVGAARGGGAEAVLIGGRKAFTGCGNGKGSGKENDGGGTIAAAEGVAV